MMSYMDAARWASDMLVRHRSAAAVLYTAYICRALFCVAPMKSAEGSLN